MEERNPGVRKLEGAGPKHLKTIVLPSTRAHGMRNSNKILHSEEHKRKIFTVSTTPATTAKI